MKEIMQKLKRVVHFPAKLARQGASCSLQSSLWEGQQALESSHCRYQPVSTATAVMQLTAPRWLKPAATSPSPDLQDISSWPWVWEFSGQCHTGARQTFAKSIPRAHLCWVGTSAFFLHLLVLNSCNETTFRHGRHHLLETLEDKCFIYNCQNLLNCHLIFTTVIRKLVLSSTFLRHPRRTASSYPGCP